MLVRIDCRLLCRSRLHTVVGEDHISRAHDAVAVYIQAVFGVNLQLFFRGRLCLHLCSHIAASGIGFEILCPDQRCLVSLRIPGLKVQLPEAGRPVGSEVIRRERRGRDHMETAFFRFRDCHA